METRLKKGGEAKTETRGAQQPKLMHREEVNSMHVGRQASRQVGK